MRIIHHGAQFGVTGSCHELKLEDRSLLVDCGLYQGADRKFQHHANAIDIPSVELLVLTHVHIDHVGRVPWLVWSGYQGPIYLTKASARLLPEVLSDAMEFDNDIPLEDRESVFEKMVAMLVPCDYDQSINISLGDQEGTLRFRIAGHILGSAFVEMQLAGKSITFSGDLGCKNTPLLPDVAPHAARGVDRVSRRERGPRARRGGAAPGHAPPAQTADEGKALPPMKLKHRPNDFKVDELLITIQRALDCHIPGLA